MTRSDVGKGHPEYYQDLAERIAARDPRRLLRQPVQQPGQPAGARDRHRPGDLGADGPRRRRDRRRRRLRRHADRADALLPRRAPRARDGAGRPGRLDPAPSTSRTGTIGEAGSWVVEGIGEDFIPPIADLSRVRAGLFDHRRRELRHRARAARSAKASSPARRPARCSPRRCAIAARRPTPKRVVTFVCDTGNKYLSKIYNDYWMIDQGLLERAALRRPARPDRAPRRARAPRSPSAPDDTLLTAYPAHAALRRLAAAGARRRPARRHRRRVGPAAERARATPERFRAPVGERHDRRSSTRMRAERQPRRARCRSSTAARWRSSPTRTGFHGLITRIDLLNHLRRTHRMSHHDKNTDGLGFATRAIHAGQSPDPTHRRGHDADLRDLDLRAGEPRRAQGLRLRAHPEPDALRLRALRRRSRRRHRRLRLRLGPGRRSRPCSSCSTPASHVVAMRRPLRRHASGCSSGCAGAPPACASASSTSTDLGRRSRRRSGPTRA